MLLFIIRTTLGYEVSAHSDLSSLLMGYQSISHEYRSYHMKWVGKKGLCVGNTYILGSLTSNGNKKDEMTFKF